MYKCVQGHFTNKEEVWNSFSLSRKDREYDHWTQEIKTFEKNIKELKEKIKRRS